jgi:mono/diheme cytochrome c family protein
MVVAISAVAITSVALAHRAATPAAVVGNPTAGKPIFKSFCSGCHTLSAAGATGTVGPNLDTVSLTETTIVKAITNGGATVMTAAQVKQYLAKMPAFKSSLSTTQIQNLAAYVYVSSNAAKTVKVTVTDTKFALSPTKIAAGKITFDIHNTGKKSHDFSINGKTSPAIAPAKTGSLVVTFAKAGSYPYKSTLKGDTSLKGTFKVVAAATTTTTTKVTPPPPPATTTSSGGTTPPPATTTTASSNPDGCPAGVTIQTSGVTDNDQDENGNPSDGDGCL